MSNKPYDIESLAGEIARREGKSVQSSIGNIREILRIISDIEAEQRFQLMGEGIPFGEFPETGSLAALDKSAKVKLAAMSKKKGWQK